MFLLYLFILYYQRCIIITILSCLIHNKGVCVATEPNLTLSISGLLAGDPNRERKPLSGLRSFSQIGRLGLLEQLGIITMAVLWGQTYVLKL